MKIKNIKARWIFIKFDKIKDCNSNGIISFEELSKKADNFHLSTQFSGINIPEEARVKIEEV